MGKNTSGFTLIELSIVLVIIGLIIGGVLVGQDLIAAAAVRSQIAQIEKYNTAVNTFRGKYNNQLPGDMDSADASMFGFLTRNGSYGEGDSNGYLQSNNGAFNDPGYAVSYVEAYGETGVFWNDLSTAGLIEGSYNGQIIWSGATVTEAVGKVLLAAAIGNGNYVGVWSVTSIMGYSGASVGNYFSITPVTALTTGAGGGPTLGRTNHRRYDG